MLAKELRLNVKKKSRTQWSYSFFDVFVKHRFYKGYWVIGKLFGDSNSSVFTILFVKLAYSIAVDYLLTLYLNRIRLLDGRFSNGL